MADWNDLPPELRFMIWKVLAGDARKSKNMQQHQRTGYATVCRQWRAYFEKLNFRHLTLSPACIFDLNDRVSRYSRLMVQHICLRVELPQYHCRACHGFDMEENSLENNRILTDAIVDLFMALSRWDFIARSGVTFELSIYSCSDSKHFFRNRTTQAVEWTGEECLDDEEESRALLARMPVRQGPRHCWTDGRQVIPAGPNHPNRKAFEDAKRKLLGDPLQVQMISAHALPPVDVISGFVVRRQYHHRLAPEALGHIVRALPALRSMQYEAWCPTSVETTKLTMERTEKYQKLFQRYLPASLKRLSVFQDFDAVFQKPAHITQRSNEEMTAHLAHSFVRASINLEEASMAFIIDVRHFFAKFYYRLKHGHVNGMEGTPYWPNLTRLALTFTALRPHRPSDELLRTILHAVGCAAERMPKLETLELWNGTEAYGAVFRYERSHQTITILTSWSATFHLDPVVIEQWSRVALKHTGLELLVKTGQIPAPQHSYGSVLRFLKLRRLILHPISLHQIQWEAENPDGFTILE
ncbi:hypothetical protein CONLIGDRAFT_685569 [Coniochaeta ligniaria NRRL 30616]|uniref:DUF6546 domain-containing protein n=1 Tax=Coniochaeta ligniaria NRRL 30616 TaxID=1408157 RepID=A0A1J7IU25_9PEZI|nr:hypothetical protein CONLIGDRAFT_685569 [Coniochaeta ligniaria NRRL 30616]